MQRLNLRFYWKGMSSDVESALKCCATYQRQTRVPTNHYEAIGIECDNIWDSLVLDCSFGFPLTKPDGYHGVLVIMDRISKYHFAYPLKSKNAEDIAEKLLDCISIISPARSIQSDLGSEFINKIIEKC
jgi:hypothetical protein